MWTEVGGVAVTVLSQVSLVSGFIYYICLVMV